MKAALIAVALAAASPDPIAIVHENGVFVIQPATLHAYENGNKVQQVDVFVDLSTKEGASRHRVGVTGCDLGRGQIARVADDGSAVTPPRDWSTSGSRVLDLLAAGICSTAHPRSQFPTQARPAAKLSA